MLTASQIKELVKGGEGYNVDFKRSVPSKVKEISDEVAGFANAAGGYVLIGVDSDNQIIGAEIDNNKRSAIQDTIGEISPALKCEFYPVEVEGKNVWVIDVPSGKDKPYITGGVIKDIQLMASGNSAESALDCHRRVRGVIAEQNFDSHGCKVGKND